MQHAGEERASTRSLALAVDGVSGFKQKNPRRIDSDGGRHWADIARASYFALKSKFHQPSSHFKVTFRHPKGTCG